MPDNQGLLTDLGADGPDLAILLAAGYGALVAELQEAHLRLGLDVRPSFGFVIRAVAAEEPGISRLADLLGVTKQAASQLADEVENVGYIERFEDPDDRRRRRLRLTAIGNEVRTNALATSAALERDLIDAVGVDAVAGFRATLLALSARAGALEDVLARRARLVW
jgi:DNA-binding MarR family transcriptional regulator